MKIKGAIFDMDGTLVDSLFFWPEFWKVLGKKYLNQDNFCPDEEIDRRIRTMVFVDALKAIKEHFRFNVDDESLIRFAYSSLADFYETKVFLKDGALALLDDLKKKGIKICLASATDMSYIKLTLNHLDIARFFDCVLSCADLGVGKDKPDIYLLAAEHLGCTPQELCVFEDSFVALETARDAEFHTVGIFDRNNFGQERLRNASEIYVEDGKGLDTLIEYIQSL